MIVYDLRCAHGHRFEGWFSSADDFVRQKDARILGCPNCSDTSIERMPSATRINTGASHQSAPIPAPADTTILPAEFEGKDPLAIAQILHARMVDEMLTRSEDVGQKFPEEARRIFYDQAPARPIRGIATQQEAQDLVDEGIPVAQIPVPPKSQLN